MATLALNSGLWVRRLLIGGSPDQGRYPASKANDGTSPEKPVHLTFGNRCRPWVCCPGSGTGILLASDTRFRSLWAMLACLGASSSVSPMAKQVRLTLAKAIAKANLRRAEAGEKPITMNSLAVQAGVPASTIWG